MLRYKTHHLWTQVLEERDGFNCWWITSEKTNREWAYCENNTYLGVTEYTVTWLRYNVNTRLVHTVSGDCFGDDIKCLAPKNVMLQAPQWLTFQKGTSAKFICQGTKTKLINVDESGSHHWKRRLPNWPATIRAVSTASTAVKVWVFLWCTFA